MNSLEEQIHAYKELTRQIADLEERKKELSLAILEQMSEKTLSVKGYVVRRYDRLSFQVSLEQARELNATKMEEVLDKDALKKLHQAGQSIPGISSSQFIQVSLQKEALVAEKDVAQ
jgi:hypothetical protein